MRGWRAVSDAINNSLRDGTVAAIWCPRCGMFAPGPWPFGVVTLHTCGLVTDE